jgi:hypothetical protein
LGRDKKTNRGVGGWKKGQGMEKFVMKKVLDLN